MNKRVKGMIIGAAAIVVLAGLMVFLLLTKDSSGDTASSSSQTSTAPTYALIEQNKDNFTSLDITNKTGSYSIKSTGEDKYEISDLTKFTQTDSLYSTAASSFSALNASNKVLDTVEDKAEFGLDNPSATAVVNFTDKSYTLTLGSKAAGSAGYYAMISGDEALYTVSATVGETMERNMLYYLDKTLIPSYDTQDPEAIPDVTKLSVTRKDLEVPLVIEKYSGSDTNRMYSSSYEMTSPIKCDIDTEADQTYILALFGMSATDVAAIYDEADAAKYGFDDPTAVIDLTYDNLNVKLTIGNVTEEVDAEGNPTTSDNYYALCNDNGLVYKISKNNLNLLNVQPDELLNAIAILPQIVDVDRVSVTLNGVTRQFKLTNTPQESEDESDTSSEPVMETTAVTCDGKAIDVDQFKQYYQLMIYPKIEKINTNPVTGEPNCNMTFYYSDGHTDSMDFFIGDSRRVQMAVNGEWKFEGRAGFIDKLETEMNHLLNGDKVDTDW